MPRFRKTWRGCFHRARIPPRDRHHRARRYRRRSAGRGNNDNTSSALAPPSRPSGMTAANNVCVPADDRRGQRRAFSVRSTRPTSMTVQSRVVCGHRYALRRQADRRFHVCHYCAERLLIIRTGEGTDVAKAAVNRCRRLERQASSGVLMAADVPTASGSEFRLRRLYLNTGVPRIIRQGHHRHGGVRAAGSFFDALRESCGAGARLTVQVPMPRTRRRRPKGDACWKNKAGRYGDAELDMLCRVMPGTVLAWPRALQRWPRD